MGWRTNEFESKATGKERHDRKELADKTHEGFTIVCNRCGSAIVIIESDVCSSAESGIWGGVDLKCTECSKSTEIWGA